MYRYELWYSGSCITEDGGYESEDEAYEEAEDRIIDTIEYWELENAWDPDTESREDFEIAIIEE